MNYIFTILFIFSMQYIAIAQDNQRVDCNTEACNCPNKMGICEWNNDGKILGCAKVGKPCPDVSVIDDDTGGGSTGWVRDYLCNEAPTRGRNIDGTNEHACSSAGLGNCYQFAFSPPYNGYAYEYSTSGSKWRAATKDYATISYGGDGEVQCDPKPLTCTTPGATRCFSGSIPQYCYAPGYWKSWEQNIINGDYYPPETGLANPCTPSMPWSGKGCDQCHNGTDSVDDMWVGKGYFCKNPDESKYGFEKGDGSPTQSNFRVFVTEPAIYFCKSVKGFPAVETQYSWKLVENAKCEGGNVIWMPDGAAINPACGGSINGTRNHGQTVTVNDNNTTNSGPTGSAKFKCVNGRFVVQSGATCSN